ncbi:MAG: carbohydrate ABC transporter permease [Chloroflexi bacterium]|nr:carbohydrate ABC transporter permease [Chloroflexota bacterium]
MAPVPSAVAAPSRAAVGLRRIPLHLAVLLLCAAWLVPSLGLLISSVRPGHEVATTGWWTAIVPPLSFTIENYVQVLTRRDLGLSFMNSLLITVPATMLTVGVAAYAAYALAWMRSRYRDWVFLLLVAMLVVPIQITLVPVLRLFNAVGLTGTFVGIWLVHLGFGLPFAIYLLRNFFAQLPSEMLEAAAIDGASPFATFFRIVLPTSVPALASLAILELVWNWNDLLAALIFLGGRKDVAPLTVAVSNLVASHGEGWQLLTAAAFVSMTLPLVVFLTMQRYFVQGILGGSVKE